MHQRSTEWLLANLNVSPKVTGWRVKLKVILGTEGDIRQFTKHEECIPLRFLIWVQTPQARKRRAEIQIVIRRVRLASPNNDTNDDLLSEWRRLFLESMNSWEVRENRSSYLIFFFSLELLDKELLSIALSGGLTNFFL